MKKIICPIIILLLFCGIVSAYTPRFSGTKKEITPQKLVLIKIAPKIDDSDKFIHSLDILFIDQLKLNQNLFSYVYFNDKLINIRDADVSYNSAATNDSTIYMAYTNDIPAQVVANMADAFKIKTVSFGRISFVKTSFTVDEQADKVNLPVSTFELKISDINVEYNKSPDPGSVQKVTIHFKNNSGFPIFKSDPSNIIAISLLGGKEKPSVMSINDNWYSTSRTGKFSQVRIADGESGSLEFDALVSPYPGSQKVSFVLAKTNGIIFPSTNFDVEFTIPDNQQKVVQVLANWLNSQNIRSEPKTASPVVSFATSGSYLLVLDDSTPGWYKVKYEGTKEGWIQSTNVKKMY